MKKIFVFITIVVSMYFISCGSSKQVVYAAPTSASQTQTSRNPFGETYSAPITGYTTDEEAFGALGIAQGSSAQMGQLQFNALKNAKTLIIEQMAHEYKSATKDYMNSVGNNSGTDLENHLERIGLQTIETMVNDVKNSSEPKFSGIDEKGNMSCYIGIRIAKKAFIEKVADNISNDEELRIRFKEEQFQEWLEKNAFKQK